MSADYCQSCLKSFSASDDSSSQVTSELRDIFLAVFHDSIDEELGDGKICKKCLRHLKAFKCFKNEIIMARQKIVGRFQQVDDITKTDPFANISLEGNDANDIYFVNKGRVPKEARDHQPVLKQKLKSKETKVQQLLKKYGVSFVDGNVGKPTKTRKVSCPVCSKILALSSFPSHIKGHEGGREYNFTCEICAKRYVSNIELVIHRRRHTGEKPYQCDSCASRFNCKKNLIDHFRNKHLNQRRINSAHERCSICCQWFSQVYLVNTHMKKAHPAGFDDGIKADPTTNHFHCKKCEGQYRNRHAFDEHVCISGAGDGPSARNDCPICSLKCESRQETIKHVQEVHAERSDGSKWKCRVCDAIVLGKIMLHVESVHVKTGSKCQFCNKELKNRRCLRNHIYVVHENGSEIRKKKRRSKKLLKS